MGDYRYVRSGKIFVDRFFKHPFERIVFVGWYMTLELWRDLTWIVYMGMRYGVLIMEHLK